MVDKGKKRETKLYKGNCDEQFNGEQKIIITVISKVYQD